MRLLSYSRVAVTLSLVATAGSACGSTAKSSTTGQSTRAAFCSADVTINKAGASASSAQDFLSVLKANGAAIATLQKDAPSGKVGTEAKALVNAANKAVASNDANSLREVPESYGADVDTYCGIDGNGDPLPAYFAQGKGTPFCSAWEQIDAGIGQAHGPAAVLTFLKDHQNLVNQVLTNSSNLPSTLRPQVQALVSSAQQAIAANTPGPLSNPDIHNDVSDASLYCGVNQ